MGQDKYTPYTPMFETVTNNSVKTLSIGDKDGAQPAFKVPEVIQRVTQFIFNKELTTHVAQKVGAELGGVSAGISNGMSSAIASLGGFFAQTPSQGQSNGKGQDI